MYFCGPGSGGEPDPESAAEDRHGRSGQPVCLPDGRKERLEGGGEERYGTDVSGFHHQDHDGCTGFGNIFRSGQHPDGTIGHFQ